MFLIADWLFIDINDTRYCRSTFYLTCTLIGLTTNEINQFIYIKMNVCLSFIVFGTVSPIFIKPFVIDSLKAQKSL